MVRTQLEIYPLNINPMFFKQDGFTMHSPRKHQTCRHVVILPQPLKNYRHVASDLALN